MFRRCLIGAAFAALAIVGVQSSAVQDPTATWYKIGDENASFVLKSKMQVMYGAKTSWILRLKEGAVKCSTASFGGTDPLPGVVKACYTETAQVTPVPTPTPDPTPTPTPDPTPTPTPDPTPTPPVSTTGDIVDTAGVVVPALYTAMAAHMADETGMAYRYGAASTISNTGVPTLFKPTDKFSRCNGAAKPDGSNCNTAWQIGGPRNDDSRNDQTLAGLYSTNQSSVLWKSDDPRAYSGVSDMSVSAFEFNTFAEKPQWLWQCGGCGLTSQNVVTYRANGILKSDGTSLPIAAARCGGPTGFCGSSVIVFADGTLATAGSTTSRNATSIKLAANKVPTGIAMTNQSEYVLVTVWDTVALKGQVAVVATAGLCDGCKPGGPYYKWWDEWMGVYPGLPNMGNVGFMKVLGYVDLPGMMAPTEIAATTGLHQFNTMMGGGHFVGESNSPLTDAAHWQSFAANGSNYGRYAKGGVAVVISKSERKVAFLDLKPLITYMNGVYFSSNVSRVSNFGQGAGQWPPTFAEGAAMPVVVKTIDLGARPTAVKTTITEPTNGRAWVATEDGTLRIFSLGGYAPGGTVKSPAPADIAAKGSVVIGSNPTSLATSKGDPLTSDPSNRQVIVMSRGTRKVQWVKFADDGNSGSVIRTLQDTRMVDPIAVEDIDNFANKSYTVSVADYGGKMVHNYRFGPVEVVDRGANPGGGTWYCQNGCPTTGGPFEYGGAQALPGKPFQMNTSNVP